MILNRCLLLTQYDKQLVKTVEKLVEPHFVDSFLLSRHAVLKNCSMFYPDSGKNDQMSTIKWVISHRIVICNPSQSILIVQKTSSENIVLFTKTFHAYASLATHKQIGLCFQ